MATKCSIAPAIVWNWVIEALASFEQTDISTLIGLVEMAPAISGDAGKHTREIVSLRILETLFDNDNEATKVDDAKTPKISFNLSERCEDVLKKILHEQTHVQMDKLEKEKWDVGPFLKHKRSSLPKCMLKKLKEAVVNDSNPLFASLKEKSKLVTSNPFRKDKEFQENKLQDDKRASVENMENLEEVVKSKDSNNIVQPDDETVNDDDDENINIAAKKEAFLKAHQCTTSQNSLTLTEWSEIDLCMKCNKRGELLVCNSDSCPLQFHESCMGSAVTLEENGIFFCPFCSYSRAILLYQEAKKRTSLARKNLQAFSSFKVQPTPNKSPTKPSDFEENEDRQIGGKNINSMINEKDIALPDPLIPDVNYNDDDGVGDGDGDPSSEQTTESTRNPIPEPSTPKQKCKEKESQKSTEAGLTINLRKRKAKHTPPPVPLFRRKKLPWTKLEEETLKKGVERYSSDDYKKIPWKEILDFGHNVFHKGRTTIDLKDKWRNICK